MLFTYDVGGVLLQIKSLKKYKNSLKLNPKLIIKIMKFPNCRPNF